jgi:hypothetical protein
MDRYEVGYTADDGTPTLDVMAASFGQAFVEGRRLVKRGEQGVQIYDRLAHPGKPQRWTVTENAARIMARRPAKAESP